RVTNPASGVAKRYRVTTKTRVTAAELARIERGLELDDGPTLPARVELIGHRGPTSVVELVLTDGRKRQVRRMFLAVRRAVKELRRAAIGPIELGALASGRFRALTDDEVRRLRCA